jgi:hypothetical protein
VQTPISALNGLTVVVMAAETEDGRSFRPSKRGDDPMTGLEMQYTERCRAAAGCQLLLLLLWQADVASNRRQSRSLSGDRMNRTICAVTAIE